jgi:hypothetical protein
MAESTSAPGANPAAEDQGLRWFPPSRPQEQVADPDPRGWHGAPAGRGNAVPAGPVAERCWLCGTRLSAYQLMADGGSACTDLRWYCRDTRVCTDRWTAQRTRRLDSEEPVSLP